MPMHSLDPRILPTVNRRTAGACTGAKSRNLNLQSWSWLQCLESSQRLRGGGVIISPEYAASEGLHPEQIKRTRADVVSDNTLYIGNLDQQVLDPD